MNDEVIARFELASAEHARKALEFLRPALDGPAYLERADRLQADYRAGLFSFYGAGGREFFATAEGVFALVALLLKVSRAEAVRLLLVRGNDLLAVVQRVIEEAHPPAQGNGQAAGGPPPDPTPRPPP